MSTYRFFDHLMLRAPRYPFTDHAPERLPLLLKDETFRQSILLASTDFYQVLENADFGYERLNEKQRFTLRKYYNRMSFRPVPFGGFASFSLLKWSESGVTDMGAEQMHLLDDREQILRERKEDPDPLIGLSVLSYQVHQEFRFLARELPDGQRVYDYRIDAIAAEPLTGRVFKLLKRGPQPFSQLRSGIMQMSGCSVQEAAEFLQFLIGEQFLHIQRVKDHLIGDATERYERPQPGKIYYAALERQATGGPSESDQRELLKSIGALQRIAAALHREPYALEQFKQAFSARFDLQQVPLLQALDPDTGITYLEKTDPSGPAWSAVHRLLMTRWIQNRQRGFYDELHLMDADIATLPPTEMRWPPTISVLFRRSDDRLLIEHAGGATATALPGRFSLFSESVKTFCREIAQAESSQHPDVIFADIHAESGPHTDNINCRARIYDHEIRLTGCAAPDTAVLLPGDLLLSFRQGQLMLQSIRNGKRVIPRLSSAFNYRHSRLDVFRLLADMAYQGLCTQLSFDPERLFPGLDFYPRITHGRCILSPAKWQFKRSDLPPSPAEMRAFRDQYHLPQWVSSGTGDQMLTFDLADPSAVEFLFDHLRNSEQIKLTEYLLPDRSVRDGHRPMAGQFAAFLYHQDSVYSSLSSDRPSLSRVGQRVFLPGSEWLYVKLYAAESSANRVLLEVVNALLRRHKPLISCWFFIRYTDPEPHIRLRIRTAAPGRIMEALEKGLKRKGKGIVRSMKTDSYERELERYGAERMKLAEQVFQAGSELSLAGLKQGCAEMPLAVWSILHMLEAMFDSPAERLSLARRSVESFRKELEVGKAERIAIDQAYRMLLPELTRLIASKPLKRYLRELQNPVKNISTAAKNLTTTARYRLAADLCHMQVNRSFTSAQRRQELSVWTFVGKFLQSQQARSTKA